MSFIGIVLLTLLRLNGLISRLIFDLLVVLVQEKNKIAVGYGMQYLGKSFVMLSSMGPFRKGCMVTCFAEDEEFIWVYLPYDWCGIRQLKIDRHTAQILFQECAQRSA